MSDVRKAVELMEANKERLRGCVLPHDFRVIPKQAEAFVPYPDYICLKCGGVVRMGDAMWYQQGLEDGKKHAEISSPRS